MSLGFQETVSDPKWTEEEVAVRIQSVFLPEVQRNVKVFRSKHYIVFSDSAAGKKFAQILDKDVYGGFKKFFPFEEKKDQRLMAIYLFKTKDAYWEFYARAFETTLEQAKKSAGVSFQDFYTTYYASPRDPTHFHEGAHQIMKNILHLSGGGSWYQEGVAVYYEDKIRKTNRYSITRNAIRVGEALPLRELFGLKSMLYSGKKNLKGYGGSRGRYGQAGSVMLFLREGPLKKKFKDFFFKMGKVHRGDVDEMEKVIQEVYGLTLEELDKKWRTYFTK
jgi:hypothetical protein